MKLASPTTSDELEAYFDFRWRQLRAPWDMPSGTEKDDLEDSAFHLMALSLAGTIIGIGRLHSLPDGNAQIRYMATDPAHRRQGIGRAIVAHLEHHARKLGAKHIVINARENALAFYLSLGYVITGDSPTLIGDIAHKLMRKNL